MFTLAKLFQMALKIIMFLYVNKIDYELHIARIFFFIIYSYIYTNLEYLHTSCNYLVNNITLQFFFLNPTKIGNSHSHTKNFPKKNKCFSPSCLAKHCVCNVEFDWQTALVYGNWNFIYILYINKPFVTCCWSRVYLTYCTAY